MKSIINLLILKDIKFLKKKLCNNDLNHEIFTFQKKVSLFLLYIDKLIFMIN